MFYVFRGCEEETLRQVAFSAIAIFSKFILLFCYININMVLTRSQLENKSKDELINELLSLSSFRSELEELKKHFIDFNTNYSRIYSELEVSKNCNSLLRERIIQLERNTLNTSQYLRREMIELNPVPNDIDNNVLEEHL